jgi:hypothetical protein
MAIKRSHADIGKIDSADSGYTLEEVVSITPEALLLSITPQTFVLGRGFHMPDHTHSEEKSQANSARGFGISTRRMFLSLSPAPSKKAMVVRLVSARMQ